MMPLAFRVTQDKKITKPSVFKKITTRSVFSTAPLLMICDQKPHIVIDFFKSCITRAGSLCWSLQVSTLRGVTDFESNFGSCSYFTQFLLDPFYRRGRVYKRKFCLSVCLSVRLSVITFSYFEYSIIWWSRPCNPYILWKLIMLATSTVLFCPSTTKY